MRRSIGDQAACLGKCKMFSLSSCRLQGSSPACTVVSTKLPGGGGGHVACAFLGMVPLVLEVGDRIGLLVTLDEVKTERL